MIKSNIIKMTINLLKSTLTYKDNEIILSKNELTILYYLIKNRWQNCILGVNRWIACGTIVILLMIIR